MNKIVIDAFGGDNAPKEVVLGVVNALKKNNDFKAVLVGKKIEIEELLKFYKYDESRVEILDAKDVITCEEEPTLAIRRKPESSICVGIKYLKENEDATAFVSAGSTGAVLASATLKLGRIKGVNRPALCPVLPTVTGGKVLMLDSGANADCKPINFCQFAVMGSIYAESLGIKNPRVGLLSNGTEDEKGSMLSKEIFALLKEIKGINFIGNIEGRDILSGDVDVVVTDGFSGNIALKSMEGAIGTIFATLKKEIKSSLKAKIGALFMKKTFKRLKGKLDYNNNGGALFLGALKPVIKVHGSSKSTAIANAVLQAVEISNFGVSNVISEKISSIGEIIV